MKLKAPSLVIPTDDPFKNDFFGRKESAKTLTEIVRSAEEPLVLCINAPWGEGKSTFVMMWRQQLINEGFKTLYFNAWENDFSDNALVSLIGELDLGIEALSQNQANSTEIHEYLKRAKKYGSGLIKRAVPTALKVATAGIIDIDDLSDEALAQFSEKIAEDQIRQYEESKKSVAGFKEQLSALAGKLASPKGEDDREPLPLVIFIDELDRCRPPYAISILESVKHFFSVSNVVFVLALDRGQLGHSIGSMYGTRMDVAGYLRRFMDIEYSLSTPDKKAFCKAQFGRFGLTDFFAGRMGELRYEQDQFEELFSELFDALDFSLRDQERAFTVLSLAIRSTSINQKLFPLLLGVLIIIKLKKQELYRDFVSGKTDAKEILNFIGSTPRGLGFLETHYGMALEAYLIICNRSRSDQEAVLASYKEVMEASVSTNEAKQRANDIIRMLDSYEFRGTYKVLNYVVEKIDLVSGFRT